MYGCHFRFRGKGLSARRVKQLLAHRSREVFGFTSWHLEGLQVWADYVRNAAHLCGGPEFVDGSLFEPPAFFQSFHGNIKSDLVAELEAVGDGLGGRKDAESRA